MNLDLPPEIFFEFLFLFESGGAAPRLKKDRTEDILNYSVIKNLARLKRPQAQKKNCPVKN